MSLGGPKRRVSPYDRFIRELWDRGARLCWVCGVYTYECEHLSKKGNVMRGGFIPDDRPRCPRCKLAMGKERLALHEPTCQGPKSLSKRAYAERAERLQRRIRAMYEEGGEA